MRRREFMTLLTGTAIAGFRKLLPAFGGLTISPFAGKAALADAWPSRPVTIICPFPAGISTDIVSRMVATDLSDKLGQNFIVENRPGATGNIGAAMVARAAPDGYTLLVATLGPAVTNKFEYKHLDFDPEQAFVPIALLAQSPLFIVGTAKLPIANSRNWLLSRSKIPAGSTPVQSEWDRKPTSCSK